MGFALAETCAARGAEVTLIAGPVSLSCNHPNIRRIDVESALEMYEAAQRYFPDQDAAILCAAVADYRPEVQAATKIKRTGDEMVIRLVPNPDIAATLGAMATPQQTLVGFALETNDEERNALGKMQRKNLDFIVLNSLQDAGAGFRVDTNKITILEKSGHQEAYSLKSKTEVAADIVNKLQEVMFSKQHIDKM